MGYKHDKKEIIRKASNILQSRGYNNTGISDILNETGIPKGSFYNFFDSKEDFCLEVIDAYGTEGLDKMKEIFINPELSAFQRLKSFYFDYMIGVNLESSCTKACLINNLSYELGANNDRIAKALNRQYTRQIQIISEQISLAQKDRDIRNDYTAVELAEFLHNNTIGGMGRMKTIRDIQPLRKAIELSFAFLTDKK